MDIVLENKIRTFSQKIMPTMMVIGQNLDNVKNILADYEIPPERINVIMNNNGSFVDKWGNNFTPLYSLSQSIEYILSKSENEIDMAKRAKLIDSYLHAIFNTFDACSDKPAFENETVSEAMQRTYKDFYNNIKTLKKCGDYRELPYSEISKSLSVILRHYKTLKSDIRKFSKTNKAKFN